MAARTVLQGSRRRGHETDTRRRRQWRAQATATRRRRREHATDTVPWRRLREHEPDKMRRRRWNEQATATRQRRREHATDTSPRRRRRRRKQEAETLRRRRRREQATNARRHCLQLGCESGDELCPPWGGTPSILGVSHHTRSAACLVRYVSPKETRHLAISSCMSLSIARRRNPDAFCVVEAA